MAVLTAGRSADAIRRTGWAFVAWGAALVLLGVAVMVWPGLTGRVLIALIGLAVLAGGILLGYSAFRLRSVTDDLWVVPLVFAVIVAAFGAVVLARPDAVSRIALTIVAVFALIGGLWDLVTGIAMLTAAKWGWLRVLRGVLLFVLGAWFILTPVSAVVAFGWLVGLMSIALGILSIATGVFALEA